MAVESSGLRPADKQFLDFTKEDAPIIKEPKKATEQPYLTREGFAGSAQQGPTTPIPSTQAFPGSSPLQGPQVPSLQPTQVQSPAALVSSREPESNPFLNPGDNHPVQRRINQLYAQKKSAEEEVTELRNELNHMKTERLAAPQTPQAQPQEQNLGGYYGGYDNQQLAPANGQEAPGGQYVSRGELRQFAGKIAEEVTRAVSQQSTLNQAHTVSRSEAEREFPEVFGNPDNREIANTIWQNEPALHKDPNGPQKAAAMALGFIRSGNLSVNGRIEPAEARKEAASGVGASVPEGSGTPGDRATRYQEALERARLSGKEADMVRARQIQLGLA